MKTEFWSEVWYWLDRPVSAGWLWLVLALIPTSLFIGYLCGWI
jgi:hypothetical protein